MAEIWKDGDAPDGAGEDEWDTPEPSDDDDLEEFYAELHPDDARRELGDLADTAKHRADLADVDRSTVLWVAAGIALTFIILVVILGVISA